MALDKYPYAERLEMARTLKAYYQMDKADFNEYNRIRFDFNWETKWQIAIEEAEAFGTDENLVDEGTDRTLQVQQLMEAIRQNYQRFIKPFIEDAFQATQPGLMNAFGVNDYIDVRVTVPKMILFAKNLHQKCVQYQAALEAVGISPVKVNLIATQHAQLVELSTNKNTFIGERSEATRLRAEKFAYMDSFTEQTARAGKNIYDKDTPKYRKYILYGSVATSVVETIYQIDGGGELSLFEGDVTSKSGFQMSNKGAVDIVVFVSNSNYASLPANALTIEAGVDNKRFLATDISDGSFGALIVRNKNTEAGSFGVQLLKMIDDE